jgi:hypothetical protein
VLHGLHVLTEKPIDISTQRADALIEAANQSNVKLGVIFQDRLKADIRRFKQWVDEGAPCEMASARRVLPQFEVAWNICARRRWRVNEGVHTVDLLLWLLGDIARVQARTATMLHAIETEDTAVAVLEFAIGAIGTLQATTAAIPVIRDGWKLPDRWAQLFSNTIASLRPTSATVKRVLSIIPPGARTRALPPPLSARFADTRPCSKTLSGLSSRTAHPPATAARAAGA